MCKCVNLKMGKYFFIVLITFLYSCNSNPKEKVVEEKPEEKVTINKLKGRWQEEKDSLHITEFDDEKMKVFYNNNLVSSYDYVIFQGIAGDGGYESPKGRTIRIEESKDHFYNFLIIVLDSNYLELQHEQSDLHWFFKRLK